MPSEINIAPFPVKNNKLSWLAGPGPELLVGDGDAKTAWDRFRRSLAVREPWVGRLSVSLVRELETAIMVGMREGYCYRNTSRQVCSTLRSSNSSPLYNYLTSMAQ